ncbi:GNAT family N-acetyltransferase [Duffyella gerundensis]|uniref:GNAT family N-acetyltransferase n=1 Tax=Duffyella gerundensis TaxID=1619313 RepID=UPI00223AB335|nr:GNAT family N-acetyltransferase [Duffyella gerundensis]
MAPFDGLPFNSLSAQNSMVRLRECQASSSKNIFFIEGVRLININIRTARASDIDSIFEVRTSVLENYLSREEMRQLGITESVVADMIEKNLCAWVAAENDKIDGFSMILSDEGCLFAAFVLPEYEGRGIGRRLVFLAEQELFKHHEIAWLETDKNSRAAKFYMQLGWGNKKEINGTDIKLEKHRSV